jgi:hypothetical protein
MSASGKQMNEALNGAVFYRVCLLRQLTVHANHLMINMQEGRPDCGFFHFTRRETTELCPQFYLHMQELISHLQVARELTSTQRLANDI